jgi:peptidoglycan/xylan/chitin deacetylase (PgdA/CDA1 family)
MGMDTTNRAGLDTDVAQLGTESPPDSVWSHVSPGWEVSAHRLGHEPNQQPATRRDLLITILVVGIALIAFVYIGIRVSG